MSDLVVSAPGSVMVTGEHAVVYGHPAIVCAIEQRVTIEATRLDLPVIRITSDIAAPLEAPLGELPEGGPYRFVLAALATAPLPDGLQLDIRSEIDPTLGLGSSAAVTIAALGVVAELTGAHGHLHSIALRIVRRLQGRGSGADLVASLTGGALRYRLPKAMLSDAPEGAIAEISPASGLPPLSLRNVGYKTPTGEVLAQVAEAWQERAAALRGLYAEMGACAEQTLQALVEGDLQTFAHMITRYQGLMARLGVSDENLDEIVRQAEMHPETLAAKISGSGLGDCVMAFGAPPPGFTPVTLAQEGLRYGR